MSLDSIISIVKKIVDICLVWLLLYYLLKNVRKNVKFSLLLKGTFTLRPFLTLKIN